jgi:hypothetical protein
VKRKGLDVVIAIDTSTRACWPRTSRQTGWPRARLAALELMQQAKFGPAGPGAAFAGTAFLHARWTIDDSVVPVSECRVIGRQHTAAGRNGDCRGRLRTHCEENCLFGGRGTQLHAKCWMDI